MASVKIGCLTLIDRLARPTKAQAQCEGLTYEPLLIVANMTLTKVRSEVCARCCWEENSLFFWRPPTR